MFRVHLKRVIIGGLACMLVALILSFVLPKVYEGTIVLEVGVNPQLASIARYQSGLSEDLERIIAEGESGDSLSEAQVLQSEALFTQALQSVATRNLNPGLLESEEKLYNMYDVTNPKDSAVAVVRVRANDPKTAADVANEVGIAYGTLRTAQSQEAVSRALLYSQASANATAKVLADLDAKVTNFRKKNHLTDVLVATQNSAAYLTGTKQLVDSANSDLKSAQGQVTALQAQLAVTPKEIIGQDIIQKRGVVVQLETNESDLLRQRDDLAVTYSDSSPLVQSVDVQLKDVRARLAAARKLPLESEQRATSPNPVYESLVQQLGTARALRDGLEKRVAVVQAAEDKALLANTSVGTSESEYEGLVRERTVAEQQNIATQLQLNDLQTRAKQVRSPRVLYGAVARDEPVAPNPLRYAAIGLIGGIGLTLLVSLSLESMKSRIYTSTQLTELTGLPVLASIPALKRRQRRRIIESITQGSPRVLEPFRYMALSNLGNGAHYSTVLFTGIGAGVGTSTAALQYSIAASEAGQKVVLVDFNRRNPAVSRIMGMGAEAGVVDVLDRTLLPGPDVNMTRATAYQRLRILPIGSNPSKAEWELSSSAIQGLLEMLASEADLIVIDCAPSDAVSDAAAIASQVDLVALVVSAAETAFKYVPAAYDIIKRAGAKDIGIVLTDADRQEEPFLVRGRYAA